jgi:hypothetical protein
MCDHEGRECPGYSCQCPCMDCLMGDSEPRWAGPVKYTYPADADGRHRTTHAENLKTGETLGSFNYDHKEGWTSNGTNFTGADAYEGWVAAVNKLAKGGTR